MKRFLKYIFCSILLLSANPAVLSRSCDTDCNTQYNNSCNIDSNCCNSKLNKNTDVRTLVLTRDQASNSMMELVGWQHAVALPDMCDWYGAWYLGFEYQRTFKPCRLAESFLGSSTLKFQGSQVANRASDAIVADYLGFADEFNENLSFNPQIQNYNVNFGVYFGLDNWCQGSFFRLFTTLNHTKWDLFNYDDDCCFNNYSCKPTHSDGGSVSPCFAGTEAIQPPANLQEALGNNVDCLTSNNCNVNQDSANPFTNFGALIGFCDRDITKLAGIMLDLGWNIYNDPCQHLGLFIRYEAPTGNRPCGDYLFEPISGNGKHHALGGGLTAHTNLWDDQKSQSLSLWLEGNVVHLFKDCQTRTFDLCNSGAYSRYMLLREFDEDGAATGNLVHASRFTRQKVNVDIDVRVDATLKFAYQCCNWGADLGYNVYYQGEENIKTDNDCNRVCNTTNNKKYGIAGLTGTCCNSYLISYDIAHDCVVDQNNGTKAINITKPNISVFDAQGAMVEKGGIDIASITPPETLSMCLAYNSTQPEVGTTTCDEFNLENGADNGYRPISCGPLVDIDAPNCDSANPELLDPINSINYKSGLAPSILTHKVFGYVNYIWADECAYNPFFGLGAEAEFTANRNNDRDYCNTDCDTKNKARLDLNQWGVFVKGGMSF